MPSDASEATEAKSPARANHRSVTPLTENRDFKVLLTSQGISSLGDAVSFTALPLLVLALTGSGFAMGIVGAVQTLPDLVFGMIAGALADRSDRKRMMLLADLGRAVLTALIPISIALGGPTMAVILLVAAPLSILRSFFLASYTASVPAVVGWGQIGRANSYFEAIYSVGFIVGPAIAGVLASTIGPGPTLGIDAVSFAFSAIGLFFVRRDLRAPVERLRGPLLKEIREGIDYIAGDPTLRSAILFWGAVSILTAPLVSALAVHITRDLGYPPSILGLVLTAYGVGTVVGALVSARRGTRGSVAPFLLGGTLVTAAALIVLAVTPEVPVMVVVAIASGVPSRWSCSHTSRCARSIRPTRSWDGSAALPGPYRWASSRSVCWSAVPSSTSRAARPRSPSWGSRSPSSASSLRPSGRCAARPSSPFASTEDCSRVRRRRPGRSGDPARTRRGWHRRRI